MKLPLLSKEKKRLDCSTLILFNFFDITIALLLNALVLLGSQQEEHPSGKSVVVPIPKVHF